MRELDLQEVKLVSGGCLLPGYDCQSGHPWDDGWGHPYPPGPGSGGYDPAPGCGCTPPMPGPNPGPIVDGIPP